MRRCQRFNWKCYLPSYISMYSYTRISTCFTFAVPHRALSCLHVTLPGCRRHVSVSRQPRVSRVAIDCNLRPRIWYSSRMIKKFRNAMKNVNPEEGKEWQNLEDSFRILSAQWKFYMIRTETTNVKITWKQKRSCYLSRCCPGLNETRFWEHVLDHAAVEAKGYGLGAYLSLWKVDVYRGLNKDAKPETRAMHKRDLQGQEKEGESATEKHRERERCIVYSNEGVNKWWTGAVSLASTAAAAAATIDLSSRLWQKGGTLCTRRIRHDRHWSLVDNETAQHHRTFVPFFWPSEQSKENVSPYEQEGGTFTFCRFISFSIFAILQSTNAHIFQTLNTRVRAWRTMRDTHCYGVRVSTIMPCRVRVLPRIDQRWNELYETIHGKQTD